MPSPAIGRAAEAVEPVATDHVDGVIKEQFLACGYVSHGENEAVLFEGVDVYIRIAAVIDVAFGGLHEDDCAVGKIVTRVRFAADQFAKDWVIPLHSNRVVCTENDFPRRYRASRKDAFALDRRFLYFDLAHGVCCRTIHYQDMLP